MLEHLADFEKGGFQRMHRNRPAGDRDRSPAALFLFSNTMKHISPTASAIKKDPSTPREAQLTPAAAKPRRTSSRTTTKNMAQNDLAY